MRSQESLELNNQINNIRALIERKHPPVDSLHYNFREMMKELEDKSHYMSKRSPTIERLRQLSNDDEGLWQREHLLNESRQKIRNFDNELEKLDKLLKMKNKLRAQKVKKEEEQRKLRIIQAMNDDKKQDLVTRKELQSMKVSEASKSRAFLGDGIPNNSILSNHPLNNLKPQKFIELYRQYLRKHKADSKCKFRFLGMGLQNTPYYHSMMASKKNREVPLMQSSASPQPSPKRNRMLLKTTMDSVYAQSPILFSHETINTRPNLFQSRLRQIKMAEIELERQLQVAGRLRG